MKRIAIAVGLVVLVLVSLVSCAPVLAVIAAGSVATTFDCPLDEGSVHPCLVAGVDVGAALHTGEVLGWLMILTWPGVVLCSFAWVWLAVRWFRRWRRARRRAVSP